MNRSAKPLISTELQTGVQASKSGSAVSTAVRADGKTAEAVQSLASTEVTRLKPGANEKANDWLLWQLADSAFPTGGFAHSGGLEATWQHRELRGGSDLIEYLRTALVQSVRNAMPFAHAAFCGAREFSEVDESCDAFLSNHVANRASRLQGQAFLASAEKTFAKAELQRFRSLLTDKQLCGHFAPVFGRVAALLNLDLISTSRLFVFVQVRGWISAAVRLNIVGPLEGQRIQHNLSAEAESAAARFGSIPLEEAAQTAPLLDLWQGTQDRLYSRLFQT